MISDRSNKARISREAGEWHALLNDTAPRIETEDLEAFSAWRADPANRAEYERIDDISRGLQALSDDPDIRLATAEALARGPERPRPRQRSSARRAGPIIGALVAASLIASLASVFLSTRPTYQTRVGETFSARLADGSRITLDTDSRVRVRYAQGERRIELLRGQALFEVAHDAARPFIVAAGDTRVRATGTRFEVRKIGQDVRVTLTQGSVEVKDSDARATTWRLSPGQALALTPTSAARAQPVQVDARAATSWTAGELTFQDVTLAEAVEELNRYSRDKIILADDAPRSTRVTGVFPAGAHDDFIAAAASLYGLESVRRANGDIELRAKRSGTL